MIRTFALLGRRPAFARLWAAELVSQIGDWFSIVAVSVVSLAAPGGGVLALATSLAAHLLPQSLAAPLGGFLADRLEKRSLLVVASLIEGVLTLGMVAAALRQEVFLMQVFLCLRSIASAAREPAAGAALPKLVERGELADANSLGAFTWSVAFAIGMSLGGLATALGAEVALGIDALTFFAAAAILRALPRLAPEAAAGATGPDAAPRSVYAATNSPLSDIARALRVAWRADMRGSIFGLTPIAFASGGAWLTLNLAGHALPLAAGAATTVGILQAVRGGGTALGPIATRSFDLGPSATARFGHVAAALVLAATALLAWSPSLVVATGGALLWGAGSGALWMILTTEIQERSGDAIRGRMIAFSGFGFTVAMSVGALVTAGAVDRGVPLLAAVLPSMVVSAVAWLALRAKSPEPSAREALVIG